MSSSRSDDLDVRELAASPVHRAVWDRHVPVELFESTEPVVSEPVRSAMDHVLADVRARVRDGSVYGPDGLVSDEMLRDLAADGYWRLRVDPAHGGLGASFSTFARLLSDVVAVNIPIGVLASTQAALGPVTTLLAFGTDEQKDRLLPLLARGERLGAFATTEPGTSSDLRAISTEAVRDGDRLLLTGEKLLITNAAPGRLANVMCRVDGDLRMLLVELPDREDETFHTLTYGLQAFRHLQNHGLVFQRLPVPAANLLPGDGRVIAYHALNHGRVAICAGTVGMMRQMLASLSPWVQTRETFGAPIGSRELVQRRLGRLAARLVGCEAVAAWSTQLLDGGYRGELEGVIAKVFSTESLKEATVDVLLKTHGGRALLDGNLFADQVHELLAPTVFEGENEILTLGFFGGLSRAHGDAVLAPMRQALGAVTEPVPTRERAGRAVAAGRPLTAYAGWVGRRTVQRLTPKARGTAVTDLDWLTDLAARLLQQTGLEISTAMRREGGRLAQHQAAVFDLAQRVHWAAVMLVTSRYGARQVDPLVRRAAACMAAELADRLTRARPSGAYYRALTELGAEVATGRFAPAAASVEVAAATR
jgi:alkylation response protein AidB-like acyl-CoA dehydrogenase